MGLITLGIGLLMDICLKNKQVHGAVDDFVTESVGWFRNWFKKGGRESLMQKLEEEPESEEVKAELKIICAVVMHFGQKLHMQLSSQ